MELREINVFLPARAVSAKMYVDIGGDLMLIKTFVLAQVPLLLRTTPVQGIHS